MISLDVVVAGRHEFRQYDPSEKLGRLYCEAVFGWQIEKAEMRRVRLGDWILDDVTGKWIEVVNKREVQT